MVASSFRSAFFAAALFAAAASPARASVEISTAATSNMSCSAGVCSPTAKKAVLNVNDLTNMLASGDTTINTAATLAQDIEIEGAVSWTSTNRLTLDAYHSIAFNKPLTVAGTGALTITTNDGGFGGDFRFFGKGHVEFSDTSSSLIINGKSYLLLKSTRQIVRFYKRHSGFVALAKSYNAAKDAIYQHALIPRFGGVFEGLGNAISNLNITSADAAVGFIVSAEPYNTSIRDFSLVNARINATGTGQAVGTLAVTDSSVSSCCGYVAVFRCSATGSIAANENSTVGGLLGTVYGFVAVLESYADVDVSAGSNSTVGGLIGYNYDGYIDQSFAAGTVAGGESSLVGGSIGKNASPDWDRGLVDSYASGAVRGGTNSYVGGLVGEQYLVSSEERAHAHILTSFSFGPVSTGDGTFAGGVVGFDTLPAGVINETYWDFDTSGITNPSHGAGNILNDPGIMGLTDQQLKSGLPAGFDPAIWGQNPKINNGYPYLIANPPR